MQNNFITKKTGAFPGSSQRMPIVVPKDGPSPDHYRVKTEMFHDHK